MDRLFLMFLIMIIGVQSVLSQTFYSINDNSQTIYYKVIDNTNKKVAVVSGSKKYTDRHIYIPEEVIYKNNVYKVTEIGNKAFKECSTIKEISFPNSIETFRDDAFQNVNFDEFVFPANLKMIDDDAFAYNLITIQENDIRKYLNRTIEIQNLGIYRLYSWKGGKLFLRDNVKGKELDLSRIVLKDTLDSQNNLLLYGLLKHPNDTLSSNEVNNGSKMNLSNDFHLNSDGLFSTDEGKDFVIYNYANKTQEQLYNMVKQNVMTSFNNPQNVLTENKPYSLSIYAFQPNIYGKFIVGVGFLSYGAYYKLVYHFKDGRIKVDAPDISQNLVVSSTGRPWTDTFSGLINGWFKGSIDTENIEKMESYFLSTLYSLLVDNGCGANEKNEEDW